MMPGNRFHEEPDGRKVKVDRTGGEWRGRFAVHLDQTAFIDRFRAITERSPNLALNRMNNDPFSPPSTMRPYRWDESAQIRFTLRHETTRCHVPRVDATRIVVPGGRVNCFFGFFPPFKNNSLEHT